MKRRIFESDNIDDVEFEFNSSDFSKEDIEKVLEKYNLTHLFADKYTRDQRDIISKLNYNDKSAYINLKMAYKPAEISAALEEFWTSTPKEIVDAACSTDGSLMSKAICYLLLKMWPLINQKYPLYVKRMNLFIGDTDAKADWLKTAWLMMTDGIDIGDYSGRYDVEDKQYKSGYGLLKKVRNGLEIKGWSGMNGVAGQYGGCLDNALQIEGHTKRAGGVSGGSPFDSRSKSDVKFSHRQFNVLSNKDGSSTSEQDLLELDYDSYKVTDELDDFFSEFEMFLEDVGDYSVKSRGNSLSVAEFIDLMISKPTMSTKEIAAYCDIDEGSIRNLANKMSKWSKGTLKKFGLALKHDPKRLRMLVKQYM